MTEPRAHFYSEPELRNPVAIIGFPNVGLVGSLFANMIVREMELPVIAGITSTDVPPYAYVTGGRPYPPVRISAGRPKPRKKKTGENAGPTKRTKPTDFVIVTSEFPPKPEQVYDIAMCILEALEKLQVKDIICIEGVGGPPPGGPILGVASNDEAQATLEAADITIMREGIVKGMSGPILAEGMHRNLKVISLLVPANLDFPDPISAARVAELISRLYPRFNVDLNMLRIEARELENHFHEQNQQELHNSDDGFYG